MPNTTTRKSDQNIRKQGADTAIEALSNLIGEAHSPYHCCLYCRDCLKDSGFQELKLTEPFDVKPGGGYYINVYDSLMHRIYRRKERSIQKVRSTAAYADRPHRLAHFSHKARS